MSIYSTPLQFGYFFSLLLWVVLLIRGARKRRLSDQLLGWVMFLLAMEMQDYTFGFSGINVLWNELNGFPRGVSLIFGPVVYFYFRAQVNSDFRLLPVHLIHAVPYGITFLVQFSIFLSGPDAVEYAYNTATMNVLLYIVHAGTLISYIYYFRKCLVIYKQYRGWSVNQFSDTELIGFSWFRNFIYAMIFWIVFREVMNTLDAIYDWDFNQDWWWHLALVGVALYIGLTGYSQRQPARILFGSEETTPPPPAPPDETPSPKTTKPKTDDAERTALANKLEQVMRDDRLFLQPEINLSELARHLKTNPSLLSATINQELQLNFNDYINTLRVEEFIKAYKADVNRHYTLLSLALDAGFNSKATFNRAFKKIKGMSPQAFFAQAM